ncbi:MAG: 4-alpha-glucanotransferase [Nevskia sp.]
MTEDALCRLAEAGGLSTRWIDYRGVPREVGADTLRAILGALGLRCADEGECVESLAQIETLPAGGAALPPMLVVRAGEGIRPGLRGALPYRIEHEDGGVEDACSAVGEGGETLLPGIAKAGYHQLRIADRSCTLAVAPARCFGIADALGEQNNQGLWGIAAQLYSLRRAGDGGIGDFSGLAAFARSAAQHGADALAVSPAHALFSADLQRFSPYSPSSRLFLNALHVDPAETFGRAAVAQAITALGIGDALAALEALPLIDWAAAARTRLDLLRLLHEKLAELPPALLADFERYLAEAGPALRDHARFEALHAHFLRPPTLCWHWRDWPAAYRDPCSVEVAAFAEARAGEVRFHAFLQWLADRGLRAAQRTAREAGMAIGLIGDLAVGTDGGGSHAWSRQQDLLIGVGVGAPPDALNALGQGWGLTAFSPRALHDQGYAPFIELLRAQLRQVGGLRIDHVLGLGRLWLVPDGRHATDGAYLRYPIEDLFKLVALESWRHRAVIVGEDMGTVPADFRPRLEAAGILGMRVLWFERDWGLFVEPQRWPAQAVALTTTHDLPTVAGWWQGRDIEWRAALKLYGEGQDEAGDRAARALDRGRLWAAFCHAGVAQGEMPAAEDAAAVVDAAAAFVARTPSPLALIPAEDVLGTVEQPNVPGTIGCSTVPSTVDEHPNWRRRLPGEVRTMLDDERVARRLRALAGERPARRASPA